MIKKYLFLCAGWLAVSLAFIGAFLPLLPTVPFALLALYCFSVSSPSFQHWLLHHPLFGSSLRRIKSGQGLSRKEKIRILLITWLSIGATVTLVLTDWRGQSLLMVIVCIETWVIWRMPTFPAPTAEL
ncbi:YbaN family protein [Motilimonas cestriensis]|uniref:YbaN family protein n=1 Tax=Motilimonas cestriensis TaxID=2742685 RepID=UPI001E30C387|nr:YbaN family protein [Motilimonas cestriensis]